jgi:predicted RNA-binding protein with PIN domain
MHHAYLIDGYNLIHALGMIQKQMAPGGLETSRQRLLEFLTAAFTSNDADVTIVFDAMSNTAGGKRSQEHAGLHIRFAPRTQSADDLIEELLEQSPQPDHLTVISNDMRLQTAARRQGARAWSHEDLLDYLDKKSAQVVTPTSDEANEKADHTSPTEIQHWLKEFEALERDPKLKEFFDLDKFE